MPKQLVMDHSGHTEHVFDRADKISVAEAEWRFNALTAEGYTAAALKPGESGGRVLRSFDPEAEHTVFMPRLVGG